VNQREAELHEMGQPHEPTGAYKRETRRKKDLARGDLRIVVGVGAMMVSSGGG
jgi:hypothetical protein